MEAEILVILGIIFFFISITSFFYRSYFHNRENFYFLALPLISQNTQAKNIPNKKSFGPYIT